MFRVPVVDLKNNPLMPTTLLRAKRWILSKKATPFWKKGVWCVRLNVKPSDDKKQPIAIGVDPGSKKEAMTVKSQEHTFLNIQMDALTWVKRKMETRSMMRRQRRNRKTPCRQPRFNNKRKKSFLPPSTLARWQWKLRILNWLRKLFPIECVVVEDVKAETKKNCKKWNKSFSPVEHGKNWFYDEIKKFAYLELRQGFDTFELRNSLGLKKSSNKMSKSFDAHCVDSWVLANWYVGGHIKPDNEEILYIKPLNMMRRNLHKLQPSKGNVRIRQGGTMSMGLKKGSLVKHKEHGLTYVGGSSYGKVSLHDLDGKRISQGLKLEDCKYLCYNSWLFQKKSEKKHEVFKSSCCD